MPALTLWSVVVLSQADMLKQDGDLDAAEASYRETFQLAEKVPGVRAALGLSYDSFGEVAQRRGQPAQAEDMFRKALAIYEEVGDRARVAVSLRRLGSVAHSQGRWDEAGRCYRQALAILQEESAHDLHSIQLLYDVLGDLAESRGRLAEAEEHYAESLALAEQRHDWDGTARSLHSLGRLCRKRGQLAEAERLYHRCLALAEGARYRPGIAAVYHELGLVALQRGKGESEQWFGRALAIHSKLGDRGAAASDYRQLGLVAIARRQWDEARKLLSDSLAITQDIGHRENTIECYQLLGGLEHEQGRWEEAESWLRKALSLAEDMGQEPRAVVCYLQLGFTAEARGDAAGALECVVRALSLARRFPQFADRTAPGQVLSSVTRRLGMGAVEECWERLTGESIPDDVRQLALPGQDAGQNEDEPQQVHASWADGKQEPMTETVVRRAARAAARRLADELDPGLRTQVEDALEAHDSDARPEQYFDPVTLGSLIVSAATLAWTIYKDQREKKPRPAPKMIIKQVELALPPGDLVPPVPRARVIEVVVEEILGNDS